VLLFRVRTHLEHRLLVKSLKVYQNRVNQELAAARTMQLQLLPNETEIKRIEAQYNVTLDWHYKPSSEIGGDWWGIHSIDNNKFGLFVADFSGHGVGSAINTFRLHEIMRDLSLEPNSPARYLVKLNDILTDMIQRGQFATMNYAIIDVQANAMTYASAGHTPPMIGCAKSKTVTMGDPRGTPLGIKKSINYVDHTIPLKRDGFLFLYSDALTESHDANQEPLGEEGLMEIVQSTLSFPAEEQPLETLLDKFYSRSRTPPTDDVTALWLQR